MKTKNFLLSVGLAAGLCLTSCSEYLEDGGNASMQSLKIEVADAGLGTQATTRASYSGYTTSFENGDRIGLYVVKGTRVVNANVLYEYDGTSWSTDADVEYNDGYSYYAYFPYVASPYTPDFSQSTVDGKFDLFINDASNKFHQADQHTKAAFQASDFMLAQGASGGGNTVTFSMYHKKGLAVFDGEGAADATFTGNIPYLMSSTKYFLMKPSTNTEFTDDESTYTLNASSGHYVTHNIAESYTNYFLTVTAPTAFTHTGGTNSYSITSYKQNSSGTKSKAAAWTATYDTDGDGVFDDSKPDWLTAFTASGDGSTSASPYNATVAAQTETVNSGTASSILSSATEVGSSSDYYDLSTNGGSSSMTTANCYMVHAPGYYKLPLVYGNAIKAGADNTVAYKPTGSLSNGTNNFVNHAGSNISAPWITKSGSGVNGGMNITVDGAQLIWQDVNGLTSNYAIDGDYLKFQVPTGSIAEGNAVIAVKSGSTIVWSWHIWVTPETYGNLTTVATGSHDYRVTPVNLGWVGSGSITKSGYEGRSCTVKISQPGGQSETFNVTQTESMTVTVAKGGNSPFYQWGRKDAFPPSNGSANTDKTVYVGSGVDSKGWYYEASTTSTIGTTIQYPWKHYYNSSNYGPVTTTYYNMWDAQNNTTDNVTSATKKTIYDPCPPGFCVPTGNLWNYFGNNGSRTMSTWDSTNKGATWNTGITGDALWFPAAGYRNISSGALYYVGSYGFYWSATPNDTVSGRRLYFYSSYWGWNDYTRAVGFSVRPVAEE